MPCWRGRSGRAVGGETLGGVPHLHGDHFVADPEVYELTGTMTQPQNLDIIGRVERASSTSQPNTPVTIR